MSEFFISKKLREETAILCGGIASWFFASSGAYFPVVSNRRNAAKLLNLVVEDAANRTEGRGFDDLRGTLVEFIALNFAEAEALLRTGWNPEDAV